MEDVILAKKKQNKSKLTKRQAIRAGYKAMGIKSSKDYEPKKMFIINK